MNTRTPGHVPAALSRISPVRRLRPRAVLAVGGNIESKQVRRAALRHAWLSFPLGQ
jgi:hypothetical protein